MTFAQELVMALGLITLAAAAIAVATLVVCALIAAAGSTVGFIRKVNGLDAKLEQVLSEVRRDDLDTYNTIPSANSYFGATVSQYFNPGDWSFGGEPPKKKAVRKKRRAA